MKKIIVIGNSIAGVCAVEEIRKHDRESEVTVFLEDRYLPYQSYLFGDFLAKDITEDKLFFRPKEFYKDHNIQVIVDKKIGKADFKKNKIATEEKEPFPFDILLIADTAHNRVFEIKGSNKTGIFGLRRLGDIKDILAILHLVETVAIQADSISGLKIAYGLRKRNKEAVFVVAGASILSEILDRDIAGILEKYLEDNGIRIVKGNAIVEILGDSDVKAIRLKSGKVIASQSVILGQARKDLRLFSDSALEIQQKILVNEFFKTNLENIYAVGDVCQSRDQSLSGFSSDDSLFFEEQGRIAGLNMVGQLAGYAPPLKAVSFKIFDWVVTLIGKTKKEDGLDEYQQFDSTGKIYKKVLTWAGRLVGAVLINAPEDSEHIAHLIRNQGDISVLGNFISSQQSRQGIETQKLDVPLKAT